jgi:hypothetical protein
MFFKGGFYVRRQESNSVEPWDNNGLWTKENIAEYANMRTLDDKIRGLINMSTYGLFCIIGGRRKERSFWAFINDITTCFYYTSQTPVIAPIRN